MTATQANIVIVTRETRLTDLKARWVSPAMAAFRLKQAHAIEAGRRETRGGAAAAKVRARAEAQAGFTEYAAEDAAYREELARVQADLQTLGLPLRPLDRQLVPTFDFWNTAAVVVIGQDGLVANIAKYAGDTPIVAVNPDPQRYDGVLLPFRPDQACETVRRVLAGDYASRHVTLAEARLNDGQRMLAFNELFVGCASHVSARYTLEVAGRVEVQSSSGMLVSTGAGTSGWLSSVFNMAGGIAHASGLQPPAPPQLRWEDRALFWAVREPFRSRQSGANLVAGILAGDQELIVESLMPRGGVIFSDGVEADFLEFNSGAIATVTISEQRANLVTD